MADLHGPHHETTTLLTRTTVPSFQDTWGRQLHHSDHLRSSDGFPIPLLQMNIYHKYGSLILVGVVGPLHLTCGIAPWANYRFITLTKFGCPCACITNVGGVEGQVKPSQDCQCQCIRVHLSITLTAPGRQVVAPLALLAFPIVAHDVDRPIWCKSVAGWRACIRTRRAIASRMRMRKRENEQAGCYRPGAVVASFGVRALPAKSFHTTSPPLLFPATYCITLYLYLHRPCSNVIKNYRAKDRGEWNRFLPTHARTVDKMPIRLRRGVGPSETRPGSP